ncbi:hypothetical protein ACHAWF_006500, partial [Thalassiosira exigua]
MFLIRRSQNQPDHEATVRRHRPCRRRRDRGAPRDPEAPIRRLGQGHHEKARRRQSGNVVNLFGQTDQGDDPVDYDGPTGQIVGGTEVNPPRKYGVSPVRADLVRLDAWIVSAILTTTTIPLPILVPHLAVLCTHGWMRRIPHRPERRPQRRPLRRIDEQRRPRLSQAHRGLRRPRRVANLEIIPIEVSVSHPNYRKDSNDFWLIKLAWPTQHWGNHTIDIDENLVHNDGDELTIAGFGDTESGGDPPEVMHEVNVNYISNAECTTTYGYGNKEIDDSMMCAGIPTLGGADTCQGDSGGPMIKYVNNSPVLVGITSWGYGCARANYPGVYARVSHVTTWIKEKVSEWTAGDTGTPDDPFPAPINGKIDNPVNWFDDDGPGYNCLFYSLGNNCGKHGDGNANAGTTANAACAACGGGSDYVAGPPAPTDPPVPTTPGPTPSPTTTPPVATPG